MWHVFPSTMPHHPFHGYQYWAQAVHPHSHWCFHSRTRRPWRNPAWGHLHTAHLHICSSIHVDIANVPYPPGLHLNNTSTVWHLLHQ